MAATQTPNKVSDKLKAEYDLDACVQWIKENNYSKVCLQFPEPLLNDSVFIASFIENQIKQRVYILGDTAYGSCCVDQVACQHVDADAVIHFGHACLSPVSSIPVFYVFPKNLIDINKFIQEVQKLSESRVLLLYDVSYHHLIGELRKQLASTPLQSTMCISELSHVPVGNACSPWCTLPQTGSHNANTLRRSFCSPPSPFDGVVYIGQSNANFNNMLVYFKDPQFYQYTKENGLQLVSKVDSMKRISYFVEKVKNAENIGIIVATLGIDGYREAIEHVKNLCKLASKKCYILSVGKPNPAKLANFPEIDVFVAVSCPESDFGDKKTYFQPIVGIFEVDLALNKSRNWNTGYVRDFRDLIEGGVHFVEVQNKNTEIETNVQLTSGKYFQPVLSSQNLPLALPPSNPDSLPDPSLSLQAKATLAVAQTFREWKGLEQTSGDSAPATITLGRTGCASHYTNEPEN